MGNNSSYSSHDNSGGAKTEKLLRRNKRTAFQKCPPSPLNPPFGAFPMLEQRTNRSRSLEPQCAEAVKLIEHSQSARYPRNKRRQQNLNYLTVTIDTNSPDEEIETKDISICITGLSQHQKMIIQKIWMRAGPRELIECAQSIMAHLLRTNNNLYKIFNLPQISEKELFISPLFNKFAGNFAMVFDFVMTNLVNDLDKVCCALESLGGHHYELGLNIDSNLWSQFQRIFEDNPPKSVHQNADGHQAWKMMIVFIIRQMRIGYQKADKNSNLLNVESILS